MKRDSPVASSQDVPPDTTAVSRLLRSAWSFAASTRVATVLIAVLVVLSLVGMVYPQDMIMTEEHLAEWRGTGGVLVEVAESLGLNRLFTTWYFTVLLSALALNTAACTARRAAGRLRRRRSLRMPSGASGSLPSATGLLSAETAGPLLHVILRGLTRVPWGVESVWADEGDGRWRVFARSGRVGFWGSMLFHAALLVVMAGGLVSSVTSFRGTALVTEGQVFADAETAYLSVPERPRVGEAFSGSRFTLEDLEFIYEGDVLTRAVAHVSVMDTQTSAPVSRTAEVNYPLQVEEKSFLLGNSGYSVGLLIESESGSDESYYALGDRQPSGYSDRIQLSGGYLDVYAIPDAALELGDEAPRRYDLTDPMAHMRLVVGEEDVWRGALRPGETADVGGYRITLTDVAMWNEMLVRGDGGRGIVYFGLWLSVLGVLFRLLDADQTVFIERRPSGEVFVSARHRFGPVASRILAQRLVDRMAAVVPASGREHNEGT